jgi:hypothetical protein
MTELEWPSPAQAALKLGVTPARVRQLLDAGRIGYARTALGRLVNPTDIARLAEERRRRRERNEADQCPAPSTRPAELKGRFE